jgi:biopolymer transport protein ExbB
MYRVILTVLATLLLFASLTAIDAQAADGGGDNATEEVQNRGDGPSNKIKQPGFVDIVFLSGPIAVLIWLLIFSSSFAMIALIVDGVLQTKRDKILPVHVVEGVRAALDEGDLGNAVAICEQNPGPLSNILMAGYSNITDGFDVVQDAVAAARDMESEKILQRINYLNLCGQIAPMLGLLGTVTGMVRAFGSLADAGAMKDQLLALAISGALWTTVAGLLISVPALLGFTIFKNLATKVLLETEATVLDLIKILRNAEVEDEDEEETYE